MDSSTGDGLAGTRGTVPGFEPIKRRQEGQLRKSVRERMGFWKVTLHIEVDTTDAIAPQLHPTPGYETPTEILPMNSPRAFSSPTTNRRRLLVGWLAGDAILGLPRTAPAVQPKTAGTRPGQPQTKSRHEGLSIITFTTKDGTQIFYEDWGSGPAISCSHGCPPSSDAWESKMLQLASNGFG